ncbi:MAG: adenylyltransferase/cytidyltransferase family protein [Chitinophagales bacterium]|jgi:cytidyltransferase-like protein
MKVMLTGCFDLLHSGHVAFLKEAASYGDLYVCIGSDRNVQHLKGRYPINPELERKYMLESLRWVHEVRINKGMGLLDFEAELDAIRPDIFIVNEDGHSPAKEQLCRSKGVQYIVSRRVPEAGLPPRSTTALRTECTIPYRIDLAGGWLDQPWVSELYPGPVLTISIEPTYEFNLRSGMATSTRQKAIELWKTSLPGGDMAQNAKMLFSYENPPGTQEVAGSQDAIGIVMPGFNRANYEGKYWPTTIDSCLEESILSWLEAHLFLIPLSPRSGNYSVLSSVQLSVEGAKALSEAAVDAWEAALRQDEVGFGRAMTHSFEAQISMFPLMVDAEILAQLERYRDRALGWKISGAGGGGYLVLWSDQPIERSIQPKIRRASLDQ